MKLHAIVLIVIALVLVATGSAYATHFSSFTGGADCAGFWGNGRIYFATSAASVELFYEVTLSQGVTTIKTITGSITVLHAAPDFSVSEAWGEELCGDYSVSGRFWFTSPTGNDSETFAAAFTCECEEDGGCHYTPGYWKNHAEAWPVLSLTIGGISYNQAQLLEILNLPVRKDATIILAHHLIAAMLNVANGADDSINDAIDHANSLLVTYPLFSAPVGSAKDMIIGAKDVLCDYNETIMPDCEGFKAPTLSRISASEDPGEKSTWGTIKSIYK